MLDLASGQSTNLTPHEGEHNYDAADISPDGKTVLITSDAHNGYDNVGLLDIATKKIEWLTDEKWELSAGTFSPDGKSLTWTANVDGNTNIYLLRHREQARGGAAAEAGRELAGRQSAALHARRLEAALLPQRRRRSQRSSGSTTSRRSSRSR